MSKDELIIVEKLMNACWARNESLATMLLRQLAILAIKELHTSAGKDAG